MKWGAPMDWKRVSDPIGMWYRNLSEYSPNKNRLSCVMKYIPVQYESITDVGCGNGQLLKALGGEGRFCCGLDTDEISLRGLSLPKVRGNIHQLPFKDMSFDVCVCTEVLEHISGDISPAMKELARITKNRIILSIPWKESLVRGMVKCHRCEAVFHMSGHVRSFRKKLIIAKTTGFKLTIMELFLKKRYQVQLGWLYWICQRWLSMYEMPGANVICPECGTPALTESGERNSLRRYLRKALRIVEHAIRHIYPFKNFSWGIFVLDRN